MKKDDQRYLTGFLAKYGKYSLPFTKVLGFVSCRVTSKVLGIGAAERSWGDVKTITSGKRSAVSSDVSEKHSIVYTSACIESARIEQYHYEKQLSDNCSSRLFWTEYTDFDNKIGSFDADEFIWKSKDISDGNSHLWHLSPRFVVLFHVESHQRFLVLVQKSVLGMT